MRRLSRVEQLVEHINCISERDRENAIRHISDFLVDAYEAGYVDGAKSINDLSNSPSLRVVAEQYADDPDQPHGV